MSIRTMMIGGAGATVPDAPTSVVATATGTTSLSVSFNAPANNGGSAITSYTVFVNGGSPVTGASSPISITGLSASTSYTITVYATNAIGNSALSSGVTGTTNSSYIGTVVFTSAREWTNTAQSNYTIPSGTTHIRVKVWGSGGSNAGYDNGLPDGDGGGGGFSDAIISVTSGETLRVAVGSPGNNGSGYSTFAGPGGGFSGILRGTTALVFSGGGGTGATNSSSTGGAGGGSSGESGGSQAGTQTSGWFFYSDSSPGSEGGGGGYWSGRGTWTAASAGGSGFIGGPGVSQASTTTGSGRTPAGTGDPEYPGGNRAYGGIGYNGSPIGNSQGYGYVIMHCYAINPSGLPAPSPRNTLATY